MASKSSKTRKEKYASKKNGIVTANHKVVKLKKIIKGLKNSTGFINGLSEDLKTKVGV